MEDSKALIRPMDCQQEFLNRINPWLDEHSEIQHTFEDYVHEEKWHYLLLKFSKADDSGFDFSIRMHPGGLIFFVELVHVHLDDSIPFEMDEAFNLVNCLLSPALRYREKCSPPRTPYWAALEYWDGKRWCAYTKLFHGLPRWKRNERILQNHILDISEFHPLHCKNTNPPPFNQQVGP